MQVGTVSRNGLNGMGKGMTEVEERLWSMYAPLGPYQDLPSGRLQPDSYKPRGSMP